MAKLSLKAEICWFGLKKHYYKFWFIERSKEQHVFEMETFCYILNVLTVPFLSI